MRHLLPLPPPIPFAGSRQGGSMAPSSPGRKKKPREPPGNWPGEAPSRAPSRHRPGGACPRQRAAGAPVSREPPDAAPSSEYLGFGTEGGDIFASSCATEKKTLSFCRLLLLSEASCSSLHFSVEPLSECPLPNCCLPSCWKHVSACSCVPR
jgi:hypothetical protein